MLIDRKTLRLNLASQMLDEFFIANDPDLYLLTTWLIDRDMVTFEDVSGGHQVLRFETPAGEAGSGVMFVSQWEHFASDPSILYPEGELDDGPWRTASYRLERYKFLKAAETEEVDYLVTDSRFLLEYTPKRVWGTNVISSDEALAIIGAHLRNRGNYLIEATTDGWIVRRLNRWLFYPFLQLSVLGPIDLSKALPDKEPLHEFKPLRALAYRCEQMMKSRDHALVNLLQPQNNQTLEEALYYFDMLLLTMGGMFDALAKIVDRLLVLESRDLEIGWNRERWLRRVKKADPVLYQLVAKGSRLRSMLKLQSRLRNTIHGEHLDSMPYRLDKDPERGLIVVSGDDAREVEAAIDNLGGPESWGKVPSYSEDMWLKVGPAMERLFVEAIGFTIELVFHFKLGTRERRSRTMEFEWPFNEEILERVAVLAGCFELRQKRLLEL